MMSFLWPELLALLVIVHLLAIIYLEMLRRKRRLTAQYASLTIVKDAMGAAQGRRRHVPPVLFLMDVTLLIASIARPVVRMPLPFWSQTIILAIDVSQSMLTKDIAPDRLSAAKAAARSFIGAKPGSTRIGVVAYSASAWIVQAPTTSREEALAAINRLDVDGNTAIGSGLLVSLKILFPDLEFDLMASDPRPKQADDSSRGISSGKRMQTADAPNFIPAAPGSDTASAIILLTDGHNTTGPDPIKAAGMAAERGVRVFTLGLGASNERVLNFEEGAVDLRLDEEVLKEIASLTGAEYFYADNGIDLNKIYQNLGSRLALENKKMKSQPYSQLLPHFSLSCQHRFQCYGFTASSERVKYRDIRYQLLMMR
jgi:Ca-activated chloride channel family protein